jgi:hypothetical protein
MGPLPAVSPDVNSVMVGAAHAAAGITPIAANATTATRIAGERPARLSNDRTDSPLNPTWLPRLRDAL